VLGWLTTKCPLDTYEKTWTERRMQWLADQFGIERLLKAKVLLLNEDFFPGGYHGTEADARRLFGQICQHMSVDATSLQFEVCPDVQLPGVAGHYDHSGAPVIRIAESQLENPEALLATCAHELAHQLLLGDKHLDRNATDHEWVTDLLPVFVGAGLFAANATVVEKHLRAGNVSWWTVGKQGYLPSRMFGYALSLFAFMRGEHMPDWRNQLRLDARVAFDLGLRYLNKTNDSLFHPDTVRCGLTQVTAQPRISQCLERLATGTPTFRLATLWDIRDHSLNDARLLEPVCQCLQDRDPAICAGAADAIATFGEKANIAIPLLVLALSNSRAEVRSSATATLAKLQLQPELVVPELAVLLEEQDQVVQIAVAQALGKFGVAATSSVRSLLSALETAMIDCNGKLADELLATLVTITPQPRIALREFFSERDAELAVHAERWLDDFEAARAAVPDETGPAASQGDTG
jgi:hypothetical protein